MGRTVVFEVGPVTLLISELRGVAGNLPDVYRGVRHRAARLQDGGAEDRLELPVLRADHLAGDPRRHARPRPVGRLHAAVEAHSAADLSARAGRGLARGVVAARPRPVGLTCITA